MQDSLGITVHEAPNRTASLDKTGPDSRHESESAGNKLDSLIAKILESLAIKDHVVLIIHSTSK